MYSLSTYIAIAIGKFLPYVYTCIVAIYYYNHMNFDSVFEGVNL